ncbi:MAG: glycoside hydrolase 5 family protein [Armatimonadota bacterium]
MRYLVAGLLLCACTSGFAQEWREIKPVPTRRDIPGMYQFVRALDPVDDPVKWTAATHGQSAKATVTAGEGRVGGRALGVRYEFSGREGLEYVEVLGGVPLPADAEGLGVWMLGGEQALPARVRIVDAAGECFQFDLGSLRPGEWALGACDFANGGHWGGDNDGVMDAPCKVTSVVLDKIGSGVKAVGEARLGQLGVYRKLTSRLEPHGLKLSVPQTHRWLVYEPGQAVQLRVQADPADKTLPALPVELTARLVDPFGRVAQSAAVKLGSAEPVAVEITPPGAGAYDLQLRLPGKEADLDAPWADLRLAVFPLPLSSDAISPFGVSTHFVGWDAPSVMPLIARAGIKHYRDELYWGRVERERGKLEIPEQWRGYLTLGKQLGLEPLIIVDYSNKLYEPEGDFPVHAESRAAFARYAGFLARECPEVRNFEIWNEWTGGCGMNGRKGVATEYAPVFLEAAKAIRLASPQARVIGIGGEWQWSEFAPMMSGGAGMAMDAASIHPYMYPTLPGDGFGEHLQKARSEAQAASGRGKLDWSVGVGHADPSVAVAAAATPLPLWITEIGWPTQVDGRGSSFLHQARCLVRMMVIALASGMEQVTWYDFKDDGTDLKYNENNFGLIHHDSYGLAPKPAYVAYAHLIRALQGRDCQGLDKWNDLRTVTFTSERDAVIVMWTEAAGQKSEARLPPGARVEDMFGAPLKAGQTVTVTQDPVFVFAPLPPQEN